MLLKQFSLPLMISREELLRRVQTFLVTDPDRRAAGMPKTDFLIMENEREVFQVFKAEPSKRFVISTLTFGQDNGLPVLIVQPKIAGRAWLGPLLFTGIALVGLLFNLGLPSRIALGVWGILPWFLLLIMSRKETPTLQNWLENELLKA